MVNLKYIGSETIHEVNFSRITPHVVQIIGNLPFEDKGFTISRIGKNDQWDYAGYTTMYRKIENGIQFSDNNSVYTAPALPEPAPETKPYIPTLEETKETKVSEMGMMQERAIQAGIEVTLSDGTAQHFDLSEKERSQLAVLQTVIARGDDKIPWHTSDESEHCKYYTNEDMVRITTAAFEHATYHETYLRDLRIYIRSLTTKEKVEAVTYGMEIPEKYRSQPLKDMLAKGS